MIELMEVIVIIAAMALVVLAAAAFALGMTAIRIENHLERLVLIEEMDKPTAESVRKEKPPDGRRKPQTAAGDYMAPMVRRAQQRMDRMEQMRSDEHGG